MWHLFFHFKCTLTHYQTTNLESSKLKEFADNFKFDENGRKLSKLVENTVGRGEIARYEQFLLFPQCFQKACFPGASTGVIVWEWVKISSAISFSLDWSKVLSSGIGLKSVYVQPLLHKYFSHITWKALLSWFHEYYARALKCLAQEHFH